MSSNKRRNYRKHLKKLLNPIYIFFSLIILVFILDHYDIASRIGLFKSNDSKVWMDFTISFISAILGVYATITAVNLTIADQEEVWNEDNRISVLPLIDISKENLNYDYRNTYLQFDCTFTKESKKREPKDIVDTATVTISLKNVGQRELYDLHITNIESPFFLVRGAIHKLNTMIYTDDEFPINFVFYELGSYENDKIDTFDVFDQNISEINFDCIFKDCYSNCYKQSLSIKLIHSVDKNTTFNERALDISVLHGKVLSPPILQGSSENFIEENSHLTHH